MRNWTICWPKSTKYYTKISINFSTTPTEKKKKPQIIETRLLACEQ